jgi:hypothetical protein
LLEDQSRDRTATRIPFTGSLEQPDVDVWSAMGSLFKHAFIEALRRGLEGSVEIEKMTGKESK